MHPFFINYGYRNYEKSKVYTNIFTKIIIHVYWKNVIGIMQFCKKERKNFSMLFHPLFSTLMDNIF